MANLPLEPENGDYESLLKKLERNFINDLKRDSKLSAEAHQSHSAKTPESYLNLDDHGNAVMKKLKEQPEFEIDDQKRSGSSSISEGQTYLGDGSLIKNSSKQLKKQSLFKYKSSKADYLAKTKAQEAFNKKTDNKENQAETTVSVAKIRAVVVMVLILCVALIWSGLVPNDFRVFLFFIIVMCSIIIVTSRQKRNLKK